MKHNNEGPSWFRIFASFHLYRHMTHINKYINNVYSHMQKYHWQDILCVYFDAGFSKNDMNIARYMLTINSNY